MRKSLPGRQRTGWSRVGRSHVTLALAALALVRAWRHSSRFCRRRKKRACVIVNAVGVAARTTLTSQASSQTCLAGPVPGPRPKKHTVFTTMALPRRACATKRVGLQGSQASPRRDGGARRRRALAQRSSAAGERPRARPGIQRRDPTRRQKASHEPRGHRGDATALLAPHWPGQLRQPRNQVC
jgi:hypothetical protein